MNSAISSSSSEITNYLNFFLGLFFSDLKNREKPNVDAKYYEAMKFLQIDIRNAPAKQELHDRMREVLNSIHDLMKDERIVAEITSGNITQSEFLKKYQEEILGDHKRKYKMDDLYDSHLIAPIIKDSNIKDEWYLPEKNLIEHPYYDNKNRLIKITPAGVLNYKEVGVANSYITHYIIEKELQPMKMQKYNVFSSININKMSEPEYKEAVLEELLSENNLNFANCEGYIGKIEQAIENMPYDEYQNKNHYVYRVNEKNILIYDSTELSAVMDFAYKLKMEEKAKNKKDEIGKKEEEEMEL